MSKELYMAEVERIAAELEDEGMDPDQAYDLASERGYEAMQDRLNDIGDMERQRRKERDL